MRLLFILGKYCYKFISEKEVEVDIRIFGDILYGLVCVWNKLYIVFIIRMCLVIFIKVFFL